MDSSQQPRGHLGVAQFDMTELDQIHEELRRMETGRDDDNNTDSVGPMAPTAGSTQKKRTYEQRKEKLDTLTKEIKYLEAKLEYLKHSAGIPDTQTVEQQRINNALLREILRNQQYLTAGFRSALSADTSEHRPSPVTAQLHLGIDLRKRYEQLNDLRQEQLAGAKQFIDARTQFTNMTLRMSESSRFQSANGDTFAVKLDVIPLPQVKNVKQVYDAIVYYMFNLEICLAEMLGDHVLREGDDDTGNARVSQHRLVTTNPDGLQVELNTVVFSDYNADAGRLDDDEAGGEGLITTDFVDSDELYPYRPHERLRKDITSIWMVKWYSTSQEQDQSIRSPSAAQKKMVVLTRWVQSKLHRSAFDIPEDTLVELSESTNRATDAVLKAVRASLQFA
uniref:Uncharacterized protein n=1 Tax=Globisporangium ultimum (strain ATCC 200006 / CBS 805.95 / DAOM BR144) TaxID=431595 RepID=K3WCP5_GLOUD